MGSQPHARSAVKHRPADVVPQPLIVEHKLAVVMIEAALDAGVVVSFVAGDEVYGLDPALRARLRTRHVGYVLAIARNQHIQATETVRMRADDVAAGLTEQAWELRTCGTGSKGERFYAWAFVHDHTTLDGGVHSLLVRRNVDTGELAFYRCWTPQPVPLATFGDGRRPQMDDRGVIPGSEDPSALSPGQGPSPAAMIAA